MRRLSLVSSLKDTAQQDLQLPAVPYKANLLCGIFLLAITLSPSGSFGSEPLVVNTTDLDLSLQWGIHCMSNILNPQDRNIPYFECWVLSRPQMRFHSQLSVGNVTGRALYALLMAESALGQPLDPEIFNKYRTVLLDSYNLVRGIPADPSTIGGPFNTCWIFNNGAGMRGLLGLAQYRNDTTAIDYFNESLLNYKSHFVDPGYSWLTFQQNFGLIGGGSGGSPAWPGPSSANVRSFPFATWSISRYQQVTGSSLAYEISSSFGGIHMAYDFPADGSFSGGDHGFEIVGRMSALAQVATMTNDPIMKDRVRKFYDNGLKDHSSQTGWFPERLSMNSDVGEINNTCEIIHTALHLGDWGFPQYYQDAERFTRAHLLPTQLLENSFVPDNVNPPTPDAYYDVKGRSKGAYGFPAPYGHIATKNPYFNGAFFFDIVAGGIAQVAEIKMNCCIFMNGNHYVNLLFDYEDENIAVTSPYPHGQTLSIIVKTAGNLCVRLSDWVDRDLLTVHSEGGPLAFNLMNYYLEVLNPPLNKIISIGFPLPIYETSEILNGRKIEMMWRGDSLIATDQMGSPLPYFQDIDDARRQLWIESLGEDGLALASFLDGNGSPDPGQLIEETGIIPAFDQKGNENGAVRLDGQLSKLRYHLPHFPVKDYTYLVWVRPENGESLESGSRTIVSAWNGSFDDPLKIILTGNSLFSGLEQETSYLTSGYPIEQGRWYHIAVVKRNGSMILYLDGTVIEQIAVPAQLETNAKEIVVGYNPDMPDGDHFTGMMDDFKFYARSLSTEEIGNIYQQEKASSVNNSLLYQ